MDTIKPINVKNSIKEVRPVIIAVCLFVLASVSAGHWEAIVKAYDMEPGEESTEAVSDNNEEATEEEIITGAEEKLPIESIEATSELSANSSDNSTYTASNLIDGDYTTVWSDGVEGSAKGEIITIKLPHKFYITRIVLYNGFLKTKFRYSVNGRVSIVAVDYGDAETTEIYEVLDMNPGMDKEPFSEDELNPTEIVNEKPMYADTIRITIVEDKAGEKYTDTTMSEIEVYGIDADR